MVPSNEGKCPNEEEPGIDIVVLELNEEDIEIGENIAFDKSFKMKRTK